MAKVKAWHADFTAGWQVKVMGPKPSADLLDAATLLAGMVRKRPGFETFGAAMAMRECGVTMQQYLNATKAAGACINTVGANDRNPFAAKRNGSLCVAKQSRSEAGHVVYSMALSAKAVAAVMAVYPAADLTGVGLVTPLPAAKPAAAPRKARAAKPAAPADGSAYRDAPAADAAGPSPADIE